MSNLIGLDGKPISNGTMTDEDPKTPAERLSKLVSYHKVAGKLSPLIEDIETVLIQLEKANDTIANMKRESELT